MLDPTIARDLVDWHHATSRRLGVHLSYDGFCAIVKKGAQ